MTSRNYSITQVSQMTGLKTHTLRFYEKEGILHPHRTESGVRYFSSQDLERLSMVCCLKRTGMPLKDIKIYFDLVEQGEDTLERRIQMFQERKQHVLKEIEDLKSNLQTVEHKINYYTGLLSQQKSAANPEKQEKFSAPKAPAQSHT